MISSQDCPTARYDPAKRDFSKSHLSVSILSRFALRGQDRSAPTTSVSAQPTVWPPPVAQVLGDVAVGSNAARGDLGDDGRHLLEERSLFVGLNDHSDNPASLTEYSEEYRKNRGRPAGVFSIQPSQLAYIQG